MPLLKQAATAFGSALHGGSGALKHPRGCATAQREGKPKGWLQLDIFLEMYFLLQLAHNGPMAMTCDIAIRWIFHATEHESAWNASDIIS